MIEKTHGIVLHGFAYGETSLIVRIFTRKLGLQSFIIKGVRKKKARIHHNLFQPLNLLELVVNHKERGGLQHSREISIWHPFQSIPLNMHKTAVAMFLAELLGKVLKEQDPQPGLFDFCTRTIRWFDQQSDNTADFHLVFMVRMTEFLGFMPQNNHSPRYTYFNLAEGQFQPGNTPQHACLEAEESRALSQLCLLQPEESGSLHFSLPLRRKLLAALVNYYRFHLEGMSGLRSLPILESIMQ